MLNGLNWGYHAWNWMVIVRSYFFCVHLRLTLSQISTCCIRFHLFFFFSSLFVPFSTQFSCSFLLLCLRLLKISMLLMQYLCGVVHWNAASQIELERVRLKSKRNEDIKKRRSAEQQRTHTHKYVWFMFRCALILINYICAHVRVCVFLFPFSSSFFNLFTTRSSLDDVIEARVRERERASTILRKAKQ